MRFKLLRFSREARFMKLVWSDYLTVRRVPKSGGPVSLGFGSFCYAKNDKGIQNSCFSLVLEFKHILISIFTVKMIVISLIRVYYFNLVLKLIQALELKKNQLFVRINLMSWFLMTFDRLIIAPHSMPAPWGLRFISGRWRFLANTRTSAAYFL